MGLSTNDQRKLYRLTPAERTMIAEALMETVAVRLFDDDERELAAQLIARMS